jgi:hypothetical protein
MIRLNLSITPAVLTATAHVKSRASATIVSMSYKFDLRLAL